MSPRQTRVLLATFAVLLGGVAVNAIFLQAQPRTAASARVAIDPSRVDRQPRVVASLRSTEGKVALRGQLKPDSATAVVAFTASGPVEAPDLVQAIQRELSNRGYGGFALDGALDTRTRAAIMAYEHDQHLPVAGEATDALLQQLVLGSSGDAAGAARPAGRSPRAEQVLRQVQQSLARLGYQPGRPDGRTSDETLRSIREFELDNGLVPTGRVSAELIAALERKTGSRSQ